MNMAPRQADSDGRGWRMAAVDVGTNSIHMIIVEAQRHGYRIIDKEKEMVQLGRDSLEGRPLTEEAIRRGVDTLKAMGEIARRWQVDEIVAVATSALREAPNRQSFIAAAKRTAGIQVRVISGEEEADYIYRAVRSAVDFHDGTALAVDIGGGSIELIVGTSGEVFFTHSEPAGALRMSQRFGLDRAADEDAVKRCRSFLRKTLRKPLARVAELGFDFTIATSGTAVTLAELAAEASRFGEGVVSGLRWLSRARLRQLIDGLTPLNVEARAKRFGIDTKRAATIVGGSIALDVIMEQLDIDHLRACDAALREGIVEATVSARAAGAEQAGAGSIRRAAVLELADRTRVDMSHATHVAHLALRIFDQTQRLHMLQPAERELLEYAALLHEAGMHVSYQRYHKHSYYLISHAGLRGMTGDQVAVVAAAVRYHRKRTPDGDGRDLAQLSRAQREVVRKLASILRVADALDRSRRAAVRDVAVKSTKRRLHFVLRPRHRAHVEHVAAARKAKYLSRLFGRSVDFELAAR